jgi:hypothetical protein
MGARYFKDPDSDARSAMMKFPCMCTGQKTGWQCQFYWYQQIPMDSLNSDEMKLGERTRACTLVLPSQLADMIDLPSVCTQYKSTGGILNRILGQARPYAPDQEAYEPYGEAEVAYLRAEWSRRKQAKEDMRLFDPQAVVDAYKATLKADLTKSMEHSNGN